MLFSESERLALMPGWGSFISKHGALHGLLLVLNVFPVCERVEIFELRLDGFALALTLELNGVSYIPFAVDLKCEGVARRPLLRIYLSL